MITVRFDSKFQIIGQLFDSILFEMKKTLFAHHYISVHLQDLTAIYQTIIT